MQKSIFVHLSVVVFATFFTISPVFAQDSTPAIPAYVSASRACKASASDREPLMEVLRSELDYAAEKLSTAATPPYYIDFRVTDTRQCKIGASFGVVTSDAENRERIFKPHIRVGSPEFDNFHNGASGSDYRATRVLLPLGDDDPADDPDNYQADNDPDDNSDDNSDNDPTGDNSDATRQVIWREVERDYRRSVAALENARAADRITSAREDSAPDFSPAPVENYYEPPFDKAETAFDRAEMRRRVEAYSAVFASFPEILMGTASVDFTVERKYFVSSEGGSVVQNLRACRLMVSALVRTADGMDLPLSNSYFAFSPADLPSDAEVMADTHLMAVTLTAMASAPVVDPYTGPALLSGEAAGVFFHEIFGHRVEGQRMKSDSDGQTFKKMVGQEVLPRAFSVYDDPTQSTFGGNDLYGHYLFDDQGVRARRARVVENGVLNEFLMTRTPTDEFASSNGHARAADNLSPVSRQSNLVVETSRPLTDPQLRKQLVREAKAQDREFGLYFKKVTGGFTQTGRYTANSFNVTPLEVYKIYVDGRPDELVRGVDLIGTPLSMFANIVEAGGRTQIFTGVCGAESGSIPVTAISPSVLVKKVEVQRKAKTSDTPPLLPRPSAETRPARSPLKKLHIDESHPAKDIFSAMRAELSRSMDGLQMDGVDKPFIINYLYSDLRAMAISATLGEITSSRLEPARMNGVRVLLGDYDTTSDLSYNGAYTLRPSAIETDTVQIRREFWLSTDLAYKAAAADMARKLAIREQIVRTPEEDSLPDLQPVASIEKCVEAPAFGFDKAEWEARAKRLSAIFGDFPSLYGSQVRVVVYDRTDYSVSSEGVATSLPTPFASVVVSASVRTPEGEEFSDSREFYATTDLALPDEGALSEDIRRFAQGLSDWALAPKFDGYYIGPVLFVGHGVFEMFDGNLLSNDGNALPAKRKPENQATRPSPRRLEGRIGKRVLDRRFSVINHSAMREWNGTPLMGFYEMDADGTVPPPSLTLIEGGMLRTLLGGRIPTPGLPASTGSNRPSVGLQPYVSPGTLEVSATDGKTTAELERDLLRLAGEDGLDYACIVERTEGRVDYVWRVDVRTGERALVRSAEVTPVALGGLRRVAGVSRESTVRNYLAGQVPSSLIHPEAVLLEDVEIGTRETTGEKPLPIVNPLERGESR